MMCSALPARAVELPSSFTLGKYLPEASWLYIHAVHNSECDWIESKWFGLAKEVVDSGALQDVYQVVLSLVPEDRRGAFREGVDKVTGPLKEIRWSDLVRHEFAYSERFTPGGVGVEYIALCRGTRDSVEHNYQKFTELVRAIAALASGSHELPLKVFEKEVNGAKTISLGIAGPDGADVLTLLVVGVRDDVVALIMAAPGGPGQGRGVAADSIPFLTGVTTKGTIAGSDRFRGALGDLRSVGETIVFFDTKRFLSTMSSNFGGMADRARLHGEVKEADGMGVLHALMSRANLFDYSITSETTAGGRTTADSVTRTQESKRNDRLLKAFRERKPFDAFDRYIPADATSFSCTAGVDVQAMYDEALEFIVAKVPGGKEIVDQIKAGWAGLGFDPQRDVFSWLSGEAISVSLPADVVKPMGGDDWVAMIRVKDAAAAQCKVNGFIDFVAAKSQQTGQGISVTPSTCGEGVRQITHPMIAMFMRPVVGVKDQWLVIGSSSKAVDRCFAVAEGKAPSIASNERFKKEGLVPPGPVFSISFTDLSKQGQELGQMAAAVGMAGGIAMSSLPPEVPAEFRQVAQSLLGVMSKLAPILSRIDFYSSTASMTRFDGEDAYRCTTVTTYKTPKSAEAVADVKDPAK